MLEALWDGQQCKSESISHLFGFEMLEQQSEWNYFNSTGDDPIFSSD